MGRSKELPGGKGKKKAEALSARVSKRRKKPTVIEHSDPEDSDFDPMDEGNETNQRAQEGEEGNHELELVFEADGLPRWKKSERLSRFPEEWRAPLYKKKIAKSKQGRKKLFLCERKVNLEEFGRFGVTECFDRLGWREFLDFNYEGKQEVYMDEILEWMSTLEKKENGSPDKTELVGFVNGKKVVLSFAILRKYAKYDTRATNGDPYEFPSDDTLAVEEAKEEKWISMIKKLFDVPFDTDIPSWPLWKENLHVFPRLLHSFVIANVMPRTSDTDRVRLYEVMILYALITGSPKLSARHLIMYNIWESRERQAKKTIPHCRLLSKMLLKQGAIQTGVRGEKAPQNPIKMSTFCRNSLWTYELRRKMHRLKVDRTDQFLEALRSDVEDDEEESEEEQVGGRKGRIQVMPEPVVTGFPPELHGSLYYKHLHEVMTQARPDEFFSWEKSTRLMYDRQTQGLEEDRVFRKAMMYQLENFRNQNWLHQKKKKEKEKKRTVVNSNKVMGHSYPFIVICRNK
ncbi:hypothetical protein HanPI659440_Chr06g0223371 [Helianthus annuus]|nr:hypothetical protein HanPI659440_Chr06g0223371 [Helianthus annuus]